MSLPPKRWSAFTLIELLIVVAIISILAAIAVPNFLQAQTRAKVARVKADMRALSTAITSYQVDNNSYPVRHNTEGTMENGKAIPEMEADIRLAQMKVITTPISYISYLPEDVFEERILPPNNVIDYYDPLQVAWLVNARRFRGQVPFVSPEQMSWLLISVGPDTYLGPLSDNYSVVETPFSLKGSIYVEYDPTNGAISVGNIFAGGKGGTDRAGAMLMEEVFRR